MAEAPFLGRAAELAAIRDLIEQADAGAGSALAVRGEAGIGKTSLLREATSLSPDVLVTWISGIESEADMGYAGLHLLLTPFLDHLAALPQPQRTALTTTFGLESGPVSTRFLVGLAALTLLTEAAAHRLVVCVVDDAQWLDPESLAALTFVARRIQHDRVTLLFGIRDSDGSDPAVLVGLPELRLGGLPDSDARRLMADSSIDDQVLERLVVTAGGNPLVLTELVRELTPDQLRGVSPLPEPLPVGRHLEQVFLRRVSRLPESARTLLLVAAAESSGDAQLVWRAGNRLGAGQEAAACAEEERFLRLGEGVDFTHPLMRSAVYHGASAAQRRAAYAALAAEDSTNPDRRAWYQALAAVQPDEDLAVALVSTAHRAVNRGGYSSAARFLHRSVELTCDESQRAARLLAAARATLALGNPVGAEVLLDRATPLFVADDERASGKRLLAAIRFARGQVRQSFPLLMEAVDLLRPNHLIQAREALFEAFEVATWTHKDAMIQAAQAARSMPPLQSGRATTADLLVEALTARMLDGYSSAYPLYRRSIETLQRGEDLRGFNLATIMASEMWDLDSQLALADRWVELARGQGALAALSLALLLRALPELWRGNYAMARSYGDAAAELSRTTTDQQGSTGRALELLYCMTGPEQSARDAAQAHLREALARGREHYGALVPELALCQLEIGLGNYPAAVTHALRVFEADTPGPTCANVMPELVEAAQRAGDLDTARAALERLRAAATASGTPVALGLLARCQALVADDTEAEALYLQAISHLEASPARPQLARAHLVYGEWLRRRRRRSEARDRLRTAHDMFDQMGAEIYARRARIELAATGERVQRRPAGVIEELTPQEVQVARLAAAGIPNREIAASLFISASTVEYHLRKAFRKLGVTARGQLRDAMEPTGDFKDSAADTGRLP